MGAAEVLAQGAHLTTWSAGTSTTSLGRGGAPRSYAGGDDVEVLSVVSFLWHQLLLHLQPQVVRAPQPRQQPLAGY